MVSAAEQLAANLNFSALGKAEELKRRQEDEQQMVEAEVQRGELVPLLEDFAAPPNGIYAVFPQRKHLPLRLRLWIDFLKHHYSRAAYWSGA